MASEGIISNKCAYCGELATQQCGNCKFVFYCNKTHQKLHWKEHKEECTCYEVKFSNELGRHVVAKKDINPGEIILEESPLVFGPKVACYPICLGCMVTLYPPILECIKCGWPLCSSSCPKISKHVEECELMSSKGYRSKIAYNDYKFESAYSVITPLRCLLLEEEKLTKLLTLQSHIENRINTPIYEIHKKNLVQFIRKILSITKYDENEILTIAGILDTNAFEIKSENTKFRGIYLKGSMLSHSCKPNADHVFLENDYKLRIICTNKIEKGEIVSISYTQTLWPTFKRISHLSQMKFFKCACNRCEDLSEFSTYFGSYLCALCKEGYLVPDEKEEFYKCQSCGNKETRRNILIKDNRIDNRVKEIVKTKSIENFTLKLLDKFMDEFSLHKNHYQVVNIKYAFLQLRFMKINDLTLQELKHTSQICEDMLELADILDPGLTTFRGTILLWSYICKRLIFDTQLKNKHISVKKYKEKIKMIESFQKEVDKILEPRKETQGTFRRKITSAAYLS